MKILKHKPKINLDQFIRRLVACTCGCVFQIEKEDIKDIYLALDNSFARITCPECSNLNYLFNY